MTAMEFVQKNRITAILRDVPSNKAVDVAKALFDGGITSLEVAFNNNDSEKYNETLVSISNIINYLDNKVSVGAGTVTTVNSVENAYRCGAQFIISPNTSKEVIKRTKELSMLSMPGAMTPSEIVVAKEAGADIIKIFPAGYLGTNYIKAISAPLNDILFMAVGGIDYENIGDFISAGCVGVGIGGNLIDKRAIQSNDFGKITKLAKHYVMAVNKVLM